jgi:hypothetical protein
MSYVNTGRNNRLLEALPDGGGFVLPDDPLEPPVVIEPPEPPVIPPNGNNEPLILVRPPGFRPPDTDNGILPPPGYDALTYSRPPFPRLALPGQEVRPDGETGEPAETGTGLKFSDLVEIRPTIVAVPGETLVQEAGIDTGGIPNWLKIGGTLAALALVFNATKEPVRKRRR